jgi:uncharacterized protein (DUF1778 family)
MVNMSPMTRDARLGLRVAQEEIDMLTALADRAGVSSSDMVRMLIRRAHAEAFGERKPKSKR